MAAQRHGAVWRQPRLQSDKGVAMKKRVKHVVFWSPSLSRGVGSGPAQFCSRPSEYGMWLWLGGDSSGLSTC